MWFYTVGDYESYQYEFEGCLPGNRRQYHAKKVEGFLAFNITSIILLTLSILGLTVFFSSISLGWLEEVVRFVLLPVAQLGAWFSGKIRERALRMKREDASGEFQSWSDRVEEMQEDIGSQSTQNGSSPWDQYIEWLYNHCDSCPFRLCILFDQEN